MTLSACLLAVSFLPYFEAKNTAANYILEPPEAGTAVKAEKPVPVIREVCPACDGKGELMLREENYGQANGRLGGGKTERRKCALCNGEKRLETFVDPAELVLQVSRDRETFTAEHLAKGDIPVGQAYVPREAHAKADRATLKLVEEAYGKPCSTCNWTGLESCRKCSGRGYLTCPNKDCKGGWSVTKTTTSYSRTKSGGGNIRGNYNRGGFSSSGGSRRISRKEEKVNVNVCPDCNGAHLVPCPECDGHKSKPCRRCNGLGTKQKGVGL